MCIYTLTHVILHFVKMNMKINQLFAVHQGYRLLTHSQMSICLLTFDN